MSRKKASGVNAGLSSIVMVFAVLCLTIFAVLSLVTSESEKRLVEKSAAAVENYYMADSYCEMVLGDIYVAWKNSSSLEHMKEAIEQIDTMPEDLYISIDSGRIFISYSKALDDSQSLQVGLAIDKESFKIKAWQLARTGEWDINEHIHVWGDNE